MKAIVLGGSGFIGSHMADLLSAKGLEVTVFDRSESAYLKPSQHMIVGSIGDLDAIKKAVAGQDYVLNFAGIAGLREAKERAITATTINVLGNLNLLAAIRENPPKRYIFASTYYVYSESGSIYRVTKQCCELFIDEYAKQYSIPFTVMRYGSVYGPRAGTANAIYRFLREAVEFGRITRKGRGDDQREYISVLDAAQATYEVMLNSELANHHIILAGQQRIKVDDLFAMINEMMGGKLSITYAPAETDDHGHYVMTPYSFKPEQAVRYSTDCHHDLGQGMPQLMHEIHDKLNESKAG